MKLLIVGDSHRHHDSVRNVLKLTSGYERVVQVGDFGFFNRTQLGQQFVGMIDRHATDQGVPWYFLPGNHEDHDDIDEWIDVGDRDDDGFVMIRPMVRMVPRSLSWVWEGYKFSALGGAHSIDKDMRTEGVDWFPQEQPRYADLDALSGPCDVLFTHDAPVNIARKFGWRELDLADHGRRSNLIVAEACRLLEPTWLVHGHWHDRLDYDFQLDTGKVRVVGLNHIHNGNTPFDGLADYIDGGVKAWMPKEKSW